MSVTDTNLKDASVLWSVTNTNLKDASVRASCCTEQPPVSEGGSVPQYVVRKKGGCIGRKQESIFESGVWTYILCDRQSINFVFHLIICLLGHWQTYDQVKASLFFN